MRRKVRRPAIPEERHPTPQQIEARTDQIVQRYKDQEAAALRLRARGEALEELHAELNKGRLDLIAEDTAAETHVFLRDVWPDHPAAAYRVPVTVEGHGAKQATRPCGAPWPWGLSKDGPTLHDYRMSSPLFWATTSTDMRPSQVAVLAGGEWRVVEIGRLDRSAVETLADHGLVLNSDPYRARQPGVPARVVAAAVVVVQYLEQTRGEAPARPPAAARFEVPEEVAS